MVLKLAGKLVGHIAISLAAKVVTLGIIAYVGHVGYERVVEGKPLLPSFSSSDPAPEDEAEPAEEDKGPGFPWFSRTLAWLAAGALLPWAAFALIRAVVRKESNPANAVALIALTLADLILAVVLLGPALAGWPLTIVLAAVILVALVYNMQIMTLAVRMEQ
jgi:hypothetical protein